MTTSHSCEKITIGSTDIMLAHPTELPLKWVGQKELIRQVLAAWMVVDDTDVPFNPRLIGKPGVGKTTLGYAAARQLNSRDRPIALRLIGVEIDLTNVSWIIRFRTFHQLPAEGVPPLLIPQGITGTEELVRNVYGRDPVQALQALIRREHPGLAALLSSRPQDAGSRLLLIQQILRQILMHEATRMLAGDPFTVGVLLSYVILKRDEIRKVRAVLNAKKYGMAADRIRSL